MSGSTFCLLDLICFWPSAKSFTVPPFHLLKSGDRIVPVNVSVCQQRRRGKRGRGDLYKCRQMKITSFLPCVKNCAGEVFFLFKAIIRIFLLPYKILYTKFSLHSCSVSQVKKNPHIILSWLYYLCHERFDLNFFFLNLVSHANIKLASWKKKVFIWKKKRFHELQEFLLFFHFVSHTKKKFSPEKHK